MSAEINALVEEIRQCRGQVWPVQSERNPDRAEVGDLTFSLALIQRAVDLGILRRRQDEQGRISLTVARDERQAGES